MTAREARNLAGSLASHRDWDTLWRLARDLPVSEAVAAARLIDSRWRPAEEIHRRYFTLLTGLEPEVVERARKALPAASVLRTDVPGRVVAGALSPDSRRLAVTAARHWRPALRRDRRRPGTISVYEMPQGTLISRYPVHVRDFAGLVYAGKKLFAVDSCLRREWVGPGPGEDPRTRRAGTRILRCRDDGAIEYPRHMSEDVAGISAYRRGFVTVSAELDVGFHDGAGTKVSGHTIPWPGELWDRRAAVAGGRGGQVAVAAGACVWIVRIPGGHLRLDARWPVHGRCTGMCFHGPRLIIADRRGIRAVPAGERDAAAAGSAPLASAAVPRARCPVSIATRDELCVLDGSGTIRYLDPVTLAPLGEPRELSGRAGIMLWSSSASPGHALGGDGFTDVVTAEGVALQALAASRQAAWQPADLATARKAAPIAVRSPQVRPLYDLLLGCLELRSGR
jgi:hypothetical protein